MRGRGRLQSVRDWMLRLRGCPRTARHTLRAGRGAYPGRRAARAWPNKSRQARSPHSLSGALAARLSGPMDLERARPVGHALHDGVGTAMGYRKLTPVHSIMVRSLTLPMLSFAAVGQRPKGAPQGHACRAVVTGRGASASRLS
jgi:hypothetical protein